MTLISPVQPPNLGVDNVIEFNPLLPTGQDGLPDYAQALYKEMHAEEHPWLASYEEHIKSYPDDVAKLIRTYYPLAWMKPSIYFDNGAGQPLIVDSLVMLIQHAQRADAARLTMLRAEEILDRAERRAARGESAAHKESNAKAWSEWQQQCRDRQLWIEQQVERWRTAIAERKVAIAQWDAHVSALRSNMNNARKVPAPARPDTAPQ